MSSFTPEDHFRPVDWEKYQDCRKKNAVYIRNWTDLLTSPKYLKLTAVERAVLHGIWMLIGLNPRAFPCDTVYLSRTFHLDNRGVSKAFRRLLLLNFIELCHHSWRAFSPKTETKTYTVAKATGADAPINGHQVTDLDALFYREGKAVLGDKSGGVLTKLKRKCGDLQEANRILREASGKGDPMEYVQGVLRRKPAKSKGWAI